MQQQVGQVVQLQPQQVVQYKVGVLLLLTPLLSLVYKQVSQVGQVVTQQEQQQQRQVA
jgi:uncharacterized membrane protein